MWPVHGVFSCDDPDVDNVFGIITTEQGGELIGEDVLPGVDLGKERSG